MGSWSRREKEGRLRDPTRPQVADEKVEPRSTATFVGVVMKFFIFVNYVRVRSEGRGKRQAKASCP